MIVCLDIGGTKTRVGISKTGESIDEHSIINTSQNFGEGIQNIQDEVKKLASDQPIAKIVAGVKGALDKEKKTLINSADLPEWKGKNIHQTLYEKFGCDVLLGNDAALAGLGEATFGPGRGKQISVYITVSTGIGGARYVDGKIDKNSFGFEPGHQIIDYESNIVCGCGGKGHLEAVSGESERRLFPAMFRFLLQAQDHDRLVREIPSARHN